MTGIAPTARNRAIVSALCERVYHGRDMGALRDRVERDYVEHNSEMESGLPALAAFLGKVFDLFPHIHFNLARLVAEGDLVVAHALMHRTPEDRGTAITEIFLGGYRGADPPIAARRFSPTSDSASRTGSPAPTALACSTS